jgi:hypothetical protein
MHSFTHNPRRTQHGARTTQSPPRRAIQCTHDRTHERTHDHTHAYHDWQDCQQRHAAARRGYCTPSSQPCKERLQQELLVIVHSTRRGPKDTSSALSTSVPPCVMSCSKGLQDTCSALYAYFLWCVPSCSQRLQEIFLSSPILHCSFVRSELPSRLATLRLRLPCIVLWVRTEQLSRLPRHLL